MARGKGKVFYKCGVNRMKNEERLLDAISVVRDRAYRDYILKAMHFKDGTAEAELIDWLIEEVGADRLLNKMCEIAVSGEEEE